MKLCSTQGPLKASLAGRLEEFERAFSYPLGVASHFRISHQPDYLRFFQAIGKAELLVAENDREILGSLVTVRRRLSRDGEPLAAHYFCDLKVRPGARGSRVLASMFAATQHRIRAGDSLSCYGIVMGGTGRLPSDYTGRLDIPAFPKIADIAVLRISGPGALSDQIRLADIQQLASLRDGLRRPGYLASGGRRFLRSAITPVPLIAENGAACGILEDTRLAKRLLLNDGAEMLSAHLSGFAFRHPESGAMLLRHALALAQKRRLPALFVAVPAGHAEPLLAHLTGVEATVAPASIFGHELEAGHDWWVDTAEI